MHKIFEDVILNRVFGGKTQGFYIDVGACDPTDGSTTKWFYDQGWSGINIEPVKDAYSKLVQERPRDINLNLALGKEPGTASFNQWSGTGLSTILEEKFDVAAARNAGYERRVVDVPVSTLAEVARQYANGPVDFLKIDVEGAERLVLEGGDWTACRPRILLIEAYEPMFTLNRLDKAQPSWQAWESIVLDSGYVFGLDDGLNRFYYRREEPELAAALERPANLQDMFTIAAPQNTIFEATLLRANENELRHETGRLHCLVSKLHRESAKQRRDILQRDEKIRMLRARQYLGLRGLYMRLTKQS